MQLVVKDQRGVEQERKNKIKGSIIWNNLHMNTTTKPLKGKYVLSLFRQIKMKIIVKI